MSRHRSGGQGQYRVRDFAVELINNSAQAKLLDTSKLDGMTAAQEASTLDDVSLWCRSHKGKDKHDLSLDTLRTTKDVQEFRREKAKPLPK